MCPLRPWTLYTQLLVRRQWIKRCTHTNWSVWLWDGNRHNCRCHQIQMALPSGWLQLGGCGPSKKITVFTLFVFSGVDIVHSRAKSKIRNRIPNSNHSRFYACSAPTSTGWLFTLSNWRTLNTNYGMMPAEKKCDVPFVCVHGVAIHHNDNHHLHGPNCNCVRVTKDVIDRPVIILVLFFLCIVHDVYLLPPLPPLPYFDRASAWRIKNQNENAFSHASLRIPSPSRFSLFIIRLKSKLFQIVRWWRRWKHLYRVAWFWCRDQL